MTIKIKKLLSVPFMENGYVVYDDDIQKRCVIVDPGLEPVKFLEFLQTNDLTPVAFLCTHGHADHMGGLALLKPQYPDAEIVIGTNDAIKLVDSHENLSATFGLPITVPAADRIVCGGGVGDKETLHLAGLEFEARHTPGHSSGHIIYRLKNITPEIVFTGDLLMQTSVGRTDFPDGNFRQLIESIRQRVYDLPDDTILYPGHGDKTTIGKEKIHNPWVPAVGGLADENSWE